MSHTYAVLDVSEETFDEIADLFTKANYDHAFVYDDNTSSPTPIVDMHGVALRRGSPRVPETRARVVRAVSTDEEDTADKDAIARAFEAVGVVLEEHQANVDTSLAFGTTWLVHQLTDAEIILGVTFDLDKVVYALRRAIIEERRAKQAKARELAKQGGLGHG